MAPSAPPPDAVRVRVTRDLGLFDLTMAAAGAMVGASIFLLIGATFAVAGPVTILSVLFAAAVVGLAGMAYAELASSRPGGEGGAYAWVRAALPAPSGFLSGWASWGGHLTAAALSALGLGAFLVELLRPSGGIFVPLDITHHLVALGVLGLAVAFHFGRIGASARTLGRLTFVKILLLAGLGFLGLLALATPDPARGIGTSERAAGPLALALGAGVIFIAFQGFEVIAQLSDQAKRPETTVPRGMLLALGLALGLYLLLFTSVLGNAPRSALDGWPNCPACLGGTEDLALVSMANLPWDNGLPFALLETVFLLVGIASMWGALNANLTSAVKTAFGMSRDGLLPSRIGEVGGREVPPVALAVTTAVAAVLLAFSLETIALLASLAFLLLFALVQASVVSLRRTTRPSGRGFRMPFVPAVPILAVALNVALGAILWNVPGPPGSRLPTGVLVTYLALLWISIGLILHFFTGGREAIRRPARAPRSDVADVLTPAEDQVELERYRVFLPLREFGDEALVEFGARVARARNGELSLLNVVEIPRNLPPKAIRFRYVDDRIKGLQKLARTGTQLGVDTRPVVKIGYKVYEIILDTVREEAVNLVVMGWRGARLEGERRILGSNIDYLIENAPCDIVVFKTQGLERPLRRIVVLTSPIWPLGGIDELALVLAQPDRSAVEVLGLARDPAEAERLKQEAEPFLHRGQAMGLRMEHRVLYSTAWESVALQESAEASCVLIRASSPGGLRRFSLGPVEDRIVKLAHCPVLILRKGSP